MVQTDSSQLSAECKEWRQILRNYRDEFQEARNYLPEICRKDLAKDQLQLIEHYDNQFYIQLINIHDVRHAIKTHERRLEQGDTSDETYTAHEKLLDQFLSLESTLQELRNDFKDFISDSNC